MFSFSLRGARFVATLAFTGALMLVAFSGTALAGTATVSGSLFTYTAEPGETNDVSYVFDGLSLTITDAASPVVPGSGCAAISANAASCTGAGLTNVEISLLDGDDFAYVDPVDQPAIDGVLVSGGSGADFLNGGEDTDTLIGNGGSDQLFGNGGNDTLIGGSGADEIHGLDGWDVASYDDASRFSGVTVSIDDAANDGDVGEGDNIGNTTEEIVGTEWNDVLGAEGASIAVFRGEDGDDSMSGGIGETRMFGGTGTDSYVPGAGADYVEYSEHTQGVTVTMGAGADDGAPGESENVPSSIDVVVGSPHADHLTGDSADNLLEGGDGDDRLFGLGGADYLSADAGNDFIDGGLGPDTGIGGDGFDTFSYATRTLPVTVNTSSGFPSGEPGEGDYPSSGDDMERVELGSGNDTFDASGGGNVLLAADGGPGNDTLRGGNFNDSLTGGSGNDTMHGFSGNDSFAGSAGNDVMFGSHGHDTFDGGADSDTVDAGPGNDVVKGGSGYDTVDYSTASPSVGLKVTIDDVANDGPSGQRDNVRNDNERLIGTTNADTFIGDDSDETFEGRGGNDKLYGDDGNDTLVGGTGTDQYFGGAGTDAASYDDGRATGVTVTMSSGANDGSPGENENVGSAGSIEDVIGSSKNDTLTGDSLANGIYGLLGGDTLSGGDGNDEVLGDLAKTAFGLEVDFSGGSDVIDAGAGEDIVSDDGGNDSIELGPGNDELFPGAGVDTIDYRARDRAVNADLGGSYEVDLCDSGISPVAGCTETDTLFQFYTGEGLAVERFILSDRNDYWRTGGFADTYFDAGGGNDRIIFDSSGDEEFDAFDAEIRGGPGNDELYVEDGNDSLFGDDGDDRLSYVSDAGGVDHFEGGAGDDNLRVTPEGFASGGPGVDEFYARSDVSGTGVTLSLDSIANDGLGSGGTGNVLSDFEAIFGTSFADSITGSDGAEEIRPMGGVDTVNALGGNDVVWTSDSPAVPDQANCGAGIDDLWYQANDTHTNCEVLHGLSGG